MKTDKVCKNPFMINGIRGIFNDGHHCDLELFLLENRNDWRRTENFISG